MNKKVENIVMKYWSNEITKEDLVSEFNSILDSQNTNQKDFFESIVKNHNADLIECLITIGYVLEDEKPFIDFVHNIITEPWHRSYEEMAHFLQSKKKPESVDFLKNAMQKKYAYLELYGTGTRQFINQCGDALWSIGTDKAITVIRELSKSNDLIMRDEMLYRISRIENKNDYERNYELE